VPSALGLACAHSAPAGSEAAYDASELFESGVLANANRGGENVHAGCVIGAALGAYVGMANIPPKFVDGLHDADEIRREIDAFVEAVVPPLKEMN